MNLFIDSVSTEGVIILFDENRIIKDKIILNIKGNESSKLIPLLDDFLIKNNIKYDGLDNIVVVNGPGSFTGIRTVVLAINTINYVIKKNITPVSFFDLFQNYPIIKSSSKRDCFVKLNSDSEIEIVKNEELVEMLNKKNTSVPLEDTTKIYGEAESSIFTGIKIFEKIDYENIIGKIEFKNYKIISPLYIKKPNIS